MYVCDNIKTPLLGRPALATFDLVKIDIPDQFYMFIRYRKRRRSAIQHTIMKNFAQVFEGLGKIKGKPIIIALYKNVIPYHIGAP